MECTHSCGIRCCLRSFLASWCWNGHSVLWSWNRRALRCQDEYSASWHCDRWSCSVWRAVQCLQGQTVRSGSGTGTGREINFLFTDREEKSRDAAHIYGLPNLLHRTWISPDGFPATDPDRAGAALGSHLQTSPHSLLPPQNKCEELRASRPSFHEEHGCQAYRLSHPPCPQQDTNLPTDSSMELLHHTWRVILSRVYVERSGHKHRQRSQLKELYLPMN